MRRTCECLRWMALLLLVTAAAKVAEADDQLPDGAKPLQEIVTLLEKTGYHIVEASIDNGHWEMDAYKDYVSYELDVDPMDGKVLFSHPDDADPAPPAKALPLSRILEAVKRAGYASVVSAEFEHGRWEIDAYRENAKRELRIDPMDGKIISHRLDD